jgi:hypothetical protein
MLHSTPTSRDTPLLPPHWSRWAEYEPELLLAELQRELPLGHVLFGLKLEPYAARRGCDDVAFRHCEERDTITVVHLTWIGRTEINADFPCVEFQGSSQEFVDHYTRLERELEEHERLMREKYPQQFV